MQPQTNIRSFSTQPAASSRICAAVRPGVGLVILYMYRVSSSWVPSRSTTSSSSISNEGSHLQAGDRREIGGRSAGEAAELLATCCLQLATCCLLPAACRLLLGCLLLAACYLLLAACCLLLAACCLLLAACYLLLAACCLQLATCCSLLATCYSREQPVEALAESAVVAKDRVGHRGGSEQTAHLEGRVHRGVHYTVYTPCIASYITACMTSCIASSARACNEPCATR